MSSAWKAEGLDIKRDRAVLLVVDVQEKLAAVMAPADMERVVKNTAILAEAARRLDIPVVLSEQYPRGLGPTVAGIKEALAPLGDRVHYLEKMSFSVVGAEGLDALFHRFNRNQWIVVGMETHVCVYQTVRDLRYRGCVVHVVRDAVCSRTQENYQVGLELARTVGAAVTSTEVVVFDLLERAGGDDFKALSKLIR